MWFLFMLGFRGFFTAGAWFTTHRLSVSCDIIVLQEFIGSISPTAMSRKASLSNASTSFAISPNKLDEEDADHVFSPTLNEALRQELVYYTTVGVRFATCIRYPGLIEHPLVSKLISASDSRGNAKPHKRDEMFLMPQQRKVYETFFKDPSGTLRIHSALSRGRRLDELSEEDWNGVRDTVGGNRGRGYSGESLVSINQLVGGLTNLGGSFKTLTGGGRKGTDESSPQAKSANALEKEGLTLQLEEGSTERRTSSDAPLTAGQSNEGRYGGVELRHEHRRVFCDKFESIFKSDGTGQRFVEYKRKQFHKIRMQANIKDEDFVNSLRTTKGLVSLILRHFLLRDAHIHSLQTSLLTYLSSHNVSPFLKVQVGNLNSSQVMGDILSKLYLRQRRKSW